MSRYFPRLFDRQQLDLSCPINPNWTGNRGLVSEWAVTGLPGWRGGLTLRDLVRGWKSPNNGTLNGGVTWQGAAGRKGGCGSLKFVSASSQYVGIDKFTTLPQGDFTVGCWVRYTGTSTFTDFIGWGNTGNNNPICILGTNHTDGTTVNFRWRNTGGTITDVTGTTVTNDGNWHFVIVTGLGGAFSLYVDGKPAEATGSGSGAQALDTLSLGATRRTTLIDFWDGDGDGWLLYNRALSAPEVASLHDQQSRGNPDRWRWLSTAKWFLPQTPGVASAPPVAAYRNRSQLITPPVFGGIRR